jgi:hypothetical protein
MRIKELLITLIVLSGLFIFLTDWQVCFPYGCDYSIQNQMCRDGGCVNEDVNSHLQEKGQIASAGMDYALALFYLAISAVLFFFFSGKIQFLVFQRFSNLILRRFSFAHNPFDLLFAGGILNPKIF